MRIPWDQLQSECGRNPPPDGRPLKEGRLKRLVLWGAGGITGRPSERVRSAKVPRPTSQQLFEIEMGSEQLVHQYYERDQLPYTPIRPMELRPARNLRHGPFICQLGKMKRSRSRKFTGRMRWCMR
jgi:hypothetical protein